MSTVVDTEANGNYEPSEGEIVEYGKWLGMKLPEDTPFLWIAREGLKAPLPENWKACQSDQGELYYFNFKTGQSIWDHPLDEHFKELLKNEKLNPTPRSVAAGAKRAEEEPAPKKEGKSSKKKQSKDASNKAASAAPQMEEAQETVKPVEVAVVAPKVQSLSSVKVKKELPKEMRIEFAGKSEEKKASPKLTAPESPSFQPTMPQSDSLLGDSPQTKSKSPTGGSAPAADEGSAVGGGSGVKSLRKMSSANHDSPSASDSPSGTVPKSAFEEEKERLVKSNGEQINELKTQLEKERREEEERLRAEHTKSLKELQESYEAEKQKKAKELRKKHDDAVRNEQKSIDDELKTSLEQAKKDMSSQKAAEVRRIREEFKEQLEQEKRKLADELAENLESFTREQRNESVSKKEALSRNIKNSETDLVNDLKQFSTAMVRVFEDTYSTFLKSVASSENDFALRSVQQKEEVQRELENQLTSLKEENKSKLEEEKQKLQRELDTIRTQHQQDKDAMESKFKAELEKAQADLSAKTQELQLAQQKESLAEVITSLKASQQTELDAIKSELKKKAEEELKAIVTDLAAQHKEQTAALAASTSLRTPQKEDGSQAQVSRREASPSIGIPPSLDDNLLRSESAQPESYAALRDSQTRDIKTAVTEALRAVFAESPFILQSPATGSAVTSPARQDSGSPTSGLSGGNLALVSPTASKFAKGVQPFTFPTSLQDQHELVEGERRRVREGRQLVESQRKNLEDHRQQFRRTRHQWKQDVMAAKEEGVRSSSKRGQLLNEVRLALEEQARGLAHDEAILHQCMAWLQSKEQRLLQLEQQIEVQERLKNAGDSSAINCSVDTAALATGFFKPQRTAPPDVSGRRMSLSFGGGSPSQYVPLSETPLSSPSYSNALSRIERRLEEVTSLINLQKTQAQGHQNQQAQLAGRKVSVGAPATGLSQSRHRSSRSQSKAADQLKDNHVDPW